MFDQHDHQLIHPRLRHPLTGEPLRAVGFSRRGPIWPILGAAEGDGGSGDGGQGSGQGQGGQSGEGQGGQGGSGEGQGSGELGDAGKRAIAEERDARKAAEKSNRALQAELDKLKQASQTEQEKAITAARKEGEQAVTERANTRLKNSEARALAAAAKFRNPATAVKLLDLSEVKVDDDGEVDSEAVKTLLKKLAEDEPYLVDDGKGTTASPSSAGIGVTGDGNGALPKDPRARRLAIIQQDVEAGRHKTTT